MSENQVAAIELGGTKTICLVGELESVSFEKKVIPTTSPSETLEQVAVFFEEFSGIKSIGIGAFGPIDILPESRTYGTVQNTPKPGWAGFNVYDFFSKRFNCPVVIDTDVNAAALGEYRAGAGKGLKNFIYVTIGTGIGGGAFINGKAVSGMSHPEMGHITLARAAQDLKGFQSCCPFHSSCAEGLASGSAIAKRWGKALNQFPENSDPWQLQAHYLTEFYHNLILMYSPQKIISGGGVSSEPLLQKVREGLYACLNGYVPGLDSMESLKNFLVLPELGNDAGPLGSFFLNEATKLL